MKELIISISRQSENSWMAWKICIQRFVVFALLVFLIVVFFVIYSFFCNHFSYFIFVFFFHLPLKVLNFLICNPLPQVLKLLGLRKFGRPGPERPGDVKGGIARRKM